MTLLSANQNAYIFRANDNNIIWNLSCSRYSKRRAYGPPNYVDRKLTFDML